MNQPRPSEAIVPARGGLQTGLERPRCISDTTALAGVASGFLAKGDGVRFYCPRCGGWHGRNPKNPGQGLRRRMAVYPDPVNPGTVILSCWDCSYVERVSAAAIPPATICDSLPGEAFREWLEANAPKPPHYHPPTNLSDQTAQPQLPGTSPVRRLPAGRDDRDVIDME